MVIHGIHTKMAWIRIRVPNFEAEQSLVEFVSQTEAYEHKFNLKINHGLALASHKIVYDDRSSEDESGFWDMIVLGSIKNITNLSEVLMQEIKQWNGKGIPVDTPRLIIMTVVKFDDNQIYKYFKQSNDAEEFQMNTKERLFTIIEDNKKVNKSNIILKKEFHNLKEFHPDFVIKSISTMLMLAVCLYS